MRYARPYTPVPPPEALTSGVEAAALLGVRSENGDPPGAAAGGGGVEPLDEEGWGAPPPAPPPAGVRVLLISEPTARKQRNSAASLSLTESPNRTWQFDQQFDRQFRQQFNQQFNRTFDNIRRPSYSVSF